MSIIPTPNESRLQRWGRFFDIIKTCRKRKVFESDGKKFFRIYP